VWGICGSTGEAVVYSLIGGSVPVRGPPHASAGVAISAGGSGMAG